MKALTLRQPWAWAVLHAGKWVENRTWRPPAAILGEPFAIHAGFKAPDAEDVATALRRAAAGGSALAPPERFDRGCVVGIATVVGFVEVDDDRAVRRQLFPGRGAAQGDELARRAMASPWFIGPVGMVLADVRALPVPVPCRGTLGFWKLPPEVEEAVVR